MLDYLVLYNSESGNTKKLAASIFSKLPGISKDLIDIDTKKDIPDASIYFVGFCVHLGTCRMEVSDFINELRGKQIALFGTCGMGCSPDYYKAIEHNVTAWIEDGNEYLGAFICQGKMPLQIRQKYETMRTDENAEQVDMFIRNFDEALVHPGQTDLDELDAFIDKCMHKLGVV